MTKINVRRWSGWVLSLGGLLLTVGAAGCAACKPFSATETEMLTLEANGCRAFELRGRVGEIRLTGDPQATTITAEIHKRGKGTTQYEADQALEQIKITMAPKPGAGDKVLARVNHPGSHPYREYEADWEVTVPAGLKVKIDAGVGSVAVSELREETKLDVGVGSIRATAMRGAIDAEAGVGSVVVELDAVPDGDVRASSGVGSVTLIVPPEMHGRLRAASGLGSLDVRLDDVPMTRVRAGNNSFEATINDNDKPTLHLSTGVGNLLIRVR